MSIDRTCGFAVFLCAALFLVSSCQNLPSSVEEDPSLPYQNVPFMVRIVDDKGVFRGTGFVVSNSGLVLTVSHVVQYGDPIYAIFSGKSYAAETVFDDPILDITMIHLHLKEELANMNSPCFWDSDSIRNGDTVLVLGQQRRGGVTLMPGYLISWSTFRIWPGSYEEVLRIYPSDPRNSPKPGFSGGPIFDIKRHIIGLFCCLEDIRNHYYNGIPSTRIIASLRETEWIDELCVVSDNEPFPLPGLVFDINNI